jgi:predicted RNase H-like HicB family nuclease
MSQWEYRQLESGRWLGINNALGLTVQSETREELEEDIADVLAMILEDEQTLG